MIANVSRHLFATLKELIFANDGFGHFAGIKFREFVNLIMFGEGFPLIFVISTSKNYINELFSVLLTRKKPFSVPAFSKFMVFRNSKGINFRE